MTSNVPTPEEFINSFPHMSIPKIVGPPPTFETLLKAKEILSECAASVNSARRGGAHGYLQLVLGDAAFNAIPGTQAWVDPVHPGTMPVIPVGATGPNIAHIVQDHQEVMREYHEFINVQEALKKMLIKFV